MRWWHWLGLICTLAVGAVAFVLGRRTALPSVDEEIEVVAGRRAARELEIERGSQLAAELIEYQYRQTIERLDQEAKDVAARLRRDPAALSEYLIRASHT